MPVKTRSQSRKKITTERVPCKKKRVKRNSKSSPKKQVKRIKAPKRSKRIATKNTNSKRKRNEKNYENDKKNLTPPKKRKLPKRTETPPKRNRRNPKPKESPETPSKALARLMNTTLDISHIGGFGRGADSDDDYEDDFEEKQMSHRKSTKANTSIIDFGLHFDEEKEPEIDPNLSMIDPNSSRFDPNSSILYSSEQVARRLELQGIQEGLLTQEVTKLTGRKSEHTRIHSFLKKHLLRQESASFYICGSPGTGKSATMNKIMKYFSKKHSFKKYNIASIIFINGMSFTNPSQIYPFLYSKMAHTNNKNVSAMTAKTKLEKLLFSDDGMMNIVVIDEMDGLLGGSQQQVLYHLFGWCKRPNCNMILFGIANSIDLTDRFLPRLKQRKFEPELLIFKPYTKKELFDILSYRLNGPENGNNSVYFDDVAIQLCAQKVASIYGDIRKCLEICRKCLDVLINDTSKTKVGFMEMKDVLTKSFQSPMLDVIRDLPNHQKVIMVVSSLLAKKSPEFVIIYDKLEQFYNFVGKKYTLPKTSSMEFYWIIDSLISDNVIQNMSKSNNGKSKLQQSSKLQILVPLDEIAYVFENDQMLNRLLESKILIPRKFIA